MIYYWNPIHGYGEKFKHELELIRKRERETKLAREREQKNEHQGNKDLL